MSVDELVISRSEHLGRIDRIKRRLSKDRADALYLTSPTRIFYVTGFSHIPTELPLAVVLQRDGAPFLMGPDLEYDHVRQECSLIDEVYTYPDYPGISHPIKHFAKVLGEKGLSTSRIATDSFQGAVGSWGYRGPDMRDVLRRARFYDGRDIIDEMRLVKSPQELRLLKESAKWSQVAHDFLLESVGPGLSDSMVGLKASQEALAQMLRKLGRRYRQLKWGLSPVIVGFRGQVGPGSAIPHAIFTHRRIRKGDVLVSEAGVEVGGYTSELERTIIVGRASPRVKRYFEVMLNAQAAALKAMHQGVRCGSVDEAARKAVQRAGLANDLRHHTGHGIGLDGHEPPWLDAGDRTLLRAGMVFSCEPGLYVPGFGGFRHSDTIAVTAHGVDFLTEYPRDLDSLTV